LNIKNLPLNIAMIGCGGYSGTLRSAISKIPELGRLIAVTTRNAENDAAQECTAAGVAIYKDVDDLFKHITPQTCSAIVIPTGIDSHFEYTKRAVENGFHVMLEKPPVATVQELDKLIELQRHTGKWIFVNFQHLFTSSTAEIKNRVMSGEFGPVKSVHAHALWRRPEEYFRRNVWSGRLRINGGWVLDGTVGNPLAHLMAEAQYLGNSGAGMLVPARIQAELYHANTIESEDTSAVRIQADNGVKLFFSASLATGEFGTTVCEIYTENAKITLTEYRLVDIEFNDGRKEYHDFTEKDDGVFSRTAMLSSMIRSINGEPPLITVEECRPFMLAWNGAFESAGIPSAIGAEFMTIEQRGQSTFRCIKDIAGHVRKMAGEGLMFSEAGIPWASPGQLVDMRNYTHFPSLNYGLIELGKMPASRRGPEKDS